MVPGRRADFHLRRPNTPGVVGTLMVYEPDADLIAHAKSDLTAALAMLAAIEAEIKTWHSVVASERDRIRKILEGNGD